MSSMDVWKSGDGAGLERSPAIEIQNLTRIHRDPSLPEGRKALDSVDITIGRTEFVSLVGVSGSGKTTLLNVTGGLDRSWTGTVKVFGRDLSGMRDKELSAMRNRVTGFVFQTFNLLSHLTVIQNVTLPAYFSKGSPAGTSGAAREALDRVGLLSRQQAFPWQLSAGERQRVAIARAILNRPGLLLCDEPTGNLDIQTGQTIIEIFRQINRDGTTLVIATHEERLAEASDRTVRLDQGRIV